ncbi:Transcriptional regulator, AraC family [Fimbriimonas ginsengisoli Gsoil 348]|uniref:Transcriptional regulator, AraC family n=2 Tax=Fimbriimonas ginsengisoli TaxID=1005039 RepID=A0A068NQ02_FIMGI|nr:Transcriptional regulator, AraC family [Fimbriimonas ginsengisoli Gsoil 348]
MGIPRHGEATRSDNYLLPEHWCFHIYSYQATIELDGAPVLIRPGYASLVPPGVRMVYRYIGPSEHVYFHFKHDVGLRMVEVPVVFDLGDHYESMDIRARQAVGLGASNLTYATSALWTLLWESASLGDDTADNGHPLVNMAIRHIEQRLSGPLSVSQLCSEVGVSYGYLTRLFKVWLGLPVSDYVRRRRADQAEHLLRSTTLPIKTIAKTVGVPDLQQFNRLIHREKGASPRAIRFPGPDTKHSVRNLLPKG